MLTIADTDVIRDVLGPSAADYDDAELTNEHLLWVTAQQVQDAVSGAADEADVDRIQMIDAAQAYLIGIELLSSDPSVSSSSLGDSNLEMGSALSATLRYWRSRYAWLVNRLNDVSAPKVQHMTLARGRRG